MPSLAVVKQGLAGVVVRSCDQLVQAPPVPVQVGLRPGQLPDVHARLHLIDRRGCDQRGDCAALATINQLPVLLFPGDFGTIS